MSTVWVALILDVDMELFDIVGVRITEADAVSLCVEAAREPGFPIDRWVEVDRTPDQSFDVAFESHPQNGVYFRIERHPTG